MTQASVIDLPPILDGIEAVCFDAFGTLVEITDRQQAFRPLFKALTPDKRREMKYRLMREDRPFTDLPEALGVEVDPRVLLEVMKRMLGLERVICFGDSDNDLSMFEAADEGYAPENANDRIKSAATAIIGHHDEEGIAHFLRERFALDAR